MGLEAPISRSQAAARVIERAGSLIAPDRRPRIQSYRFGRALEALAVTDREPVPEPQDDETRLISALEELPSRFEDGTPFGVFLFSDGRSTESQGLDQVAQYYRTLGVPIHVFPLGDESVSGDLAIQTIDAPRNAAPGRAFRFESPCAAEATTASASSYRSGGRIRRGPNRWHPYL